jgi:hypothetical protein
MEQGSKKLVIDARAIEEIKGIARSKWHEQRVPFDMATLILMGLEYYLESKGIQPVFEVKNGNN